MVRNLVAMVHVADVRRSIAYYARLGFEVKRTVGDDRLIWAWLESDRAQLMLNLADGPVDAGVQAVLFYLYVDDVEAAHARLAELSPGPIGKPFYMPNGEFRLEDPDGYVLMVGHT